MKKTKILTFLFGLLCMPVSLEAFAQNTMPSTAAPDDSRMNTQDQNANRLTADQGSNQKSDRDIMQGIRKAVVADTSLSTYAKNVKIISVNGKVTLKGPVRSDAESTSIENEAVQVAGAGNVTNQLSVKAAQ
jgi:hyperosmotically inducible protein